VELRTARLIVRDFEPADEDAVLAYRNDPVVARFQGWPLPYAAAQFRRQFDRPGPVADGEWTNFGICDAAGVCGDVGLRVHDRQADIGITLAAHAHGRGYASEALTAFVEHAFDTLGLHRLHAGVDPANEPVVRLFTRLGWRYEGTSLQSYWHRDAWADDANYALLSAEWRTRPSTR
jgi:aminoglycoside 6'-N-acetyltransferase